MRYKVPSLGVPDFEFKSDRVVTMKFVKKKREDTICILIISNNEIKIEFSIQRSSALSWHIFIVRGNWYSVNKTNIHGTKLIFGMF